MRRPLYHFVHSIASPNTLHPLQGSRGLCIYCFHGCPFLAAPQYGVSWGGISKSEHQTALSSVPYASIPWRFSLVRDPSTDEGKKCENIKAWPYLVYTFILGGEKHI